MRWKALATDFDGTIAVDGFVTEKTLQSLSAAKQAGLKLILVTGRELTDFIKTGFDLSIFDLVVVENGATLYDPSTNEETLLAPAPDELFLAALRDKGVPLSIGRTIVATVQPHEIQVFETIRDMQLEMGVIFNKGAVMILPPNINKATGLQAALTKYGIDPKDVIAVGDGENDHAFFDYCGFPVAVANAVPALKEKAKYVTEATAGSGMEELIAALLQGTWEEDVS